MTQLPQSHLVATIVFDTFKRNEVNNLLTFIHNAIISILLSCFMIRSVTVVRKSLRAKSTRILLPDFRRPYSSSPIYIPIQHKTKEPASRFEPGAHHPVKAGEVYNKRYEVLTQLGWGLHSSVWLVQDVRCAFVFLIRMNCQLMIWGAPRKKELGAMKVLRADLTHDPHFDELGILRLIRDTNPDAPGYAHVGQLLDGFVHKGPNGEHACLVLEPMGVSVFDMYLSTPPGSGLPFFVLKRVAKHVLKALEYLHEECGIVHTGKLVSFTSC